ncbi:MAG: ankyrin repeat domain-containing protein [Nitrospinae bacterium]|nr:ankyrin repeat domain-containing protein [Nitrospinota bacterium]
MQRECARGDKTGAACRGNPNVRDRRGNTPLHVLYENVERHGNFQIRELPKLPGAAGARADILKVLLQEAKADPNIRNVKGDTPLMALIRRGHTVFTKTGHASMLLGHGADPNTRNNEGETPLFEALSLPGHSRNSDYDMKRLIKLLIKHGADPDLRDTRRDTPLIRAAKHEDDIYAEIKELLAGGADPCLRDRSGKVAYDHAKKGSSVQLLLYKAGGYVDRDTGICRRNLLEARKRERKLKPSRKVKREGAGRTAWKSGRYAEALKQWRASAKKGDRRAMAALGRAFVKGVGVPQDFVEAHKWLNLAAARGDAKAAAERDALAKEMTAEERTEARNLARAWRTAGSRRVTAILPRRRAQGATRPQRRTVRKGPSGRATLRAVAAGDVSALKKALAAGADPNARGRRGWTPLMYAADKGYTLLVPPLLKAGAKPNLQAADGATALFIAALHGRSGIVELLMTAGADPRIKGPKGKTTLDVVRNKYGSYHRAREKGENNAILQILESGLTEGDTATFIGEKLADCGRFEVGSRWIRNSLSYADPEIKLSLRRVGKGKDSNFVQTNEYWFKLPDIIHARVYAADSYGASLSIGFGTKKNLLSRTTTISGVGKKHHRFSFELPLCNRKTSLSIARVLVQCYDDVISAGQYEHVNSCAKMWRTNNGETRIEVSKPR